MTIAAVTPGSFVGGGGGATGTTVAVTRTDTAGTKAHVAVFYDRGASTVPTSITVTDSAGRTWSAAMDRIDDTSNGEGGAHFFTEGASPGGSNTYTGHFFDNVAAPLTNLGSFMIVQEIAGGATTALSAHSSAVANNASVTPGAQPCLLSALGFDATGGATPSNATGGGTWVDGGTDTLARASSLRSTSTSSQTATMSSATMVFLVALTEGGGGGPTPPRNRRSLLGVGI